MTTEVKVPALPESVSDGVIAGWHKQPGDAVRRDEPLVDIETDKVVLEVPAPQDGVLEKILFNDGDTVAADQVIAVIGNNGAVRPVAATDPGRVATATAAGSVTDRPAPGPAARRLAAERGIDVARLAGSGRHGRVTKADMLAHVEQLQATSEAAETPQQAQPGHEDQQSGDQQDGGTDQKEHRCAVVIPPGDQCRRHHHQAGACNQETDDPLNGRKTHSVYSLRQKLR